MTRESSALLAEIASQMGIIGQQMARGQEAVSDVEELSAAAGDALEAILQATGEAGTRAQQIADAAAAQQTAFERLTGQIEQVAAVSARTRVQTDTLASQATEAARGQADLERAIRELDERSADVTRGQLERAIRELEGVATHLQRIARHFAVGA